MEKTKHEADSGCSACKFSDTTGPALERWLICRRHPPNANAQFVQTMKGMEMASLSAWPEVRREDWCGEFERKQDA